MEKNKLSTKVKKIFLLYLLSMMINPSITAQEDKRFIGFYETPSCGRDFFECFQLLINKDKTFKFYRHGRYLGKKVLSGTWKVQNDTLYLKESLPKRNAMIEKNNIDTLKGKLVKIDIDIFGRVTPMFKNNFIINDSLVYESDDSGIITIKDNIIISKIEISNTYGFAKLEENIFYIHDNKKINYINIVVPIKKIPVEEAVWIKQGRYLESLVMGRDGKYKIMPHNRVKKSPKRRMAPELKKEVKKQKL